MEKSKVCKKDHDALVSCHKILTTLVEALIDSSCLNLRNYALKSLMYLRTSYLPSLESELEKDLEALYNSYKNWSTGSAYFIHNTLLGLLQPRTGGISMQLRYFLPPYDLLKYSGANDGQYSTGINMLTLEEIAKQESICFSATVGLEASPR